MDGISIKQLDLELFGGCNYSCDMCPQSSGRERDFLKVLPQEVFQRIVDDALQYGLEAVSLHGGGEPLLCKYLPEAIRYVKERGLRCFFFTNGLLLEGTLATEIAQAGPDFIRISAIGYNRETYARWMRSTQWDRVRENVAQFVRHSRTEVQLYHLILDHHQVQYEVEQYQNNWIAPTGALGEIWQMHNWSGSIPVGFIRSKALRRSCGRPVAPMLQVRAGGLNGHSGAVVPCCFVLGKDGQAVLGHLDHQSIKEVLNGPEYNRLREAHQNELFDSISYCAGCDQLYESSESLVWTNIPGREYNRAKGVDMPIFKAS